MSVKLRVITTTGNILSCSQQMKTRCCHLADYSAVSLVFYVGFTKCHSETTCTDGDLKLPEIILVLAHLIVALRLLQLLLMLKAVCNITSM